MRLKINMKCINRMRTQSKTIVLIMMALKDMRRTSNCDNKRDNETKMSDYKSIWWKQPCWKAIFQQTKWLIQLIDCFLMCFKIVFSLFSDHCVRIFFCVSLRSQLSVKNESIHWSMIAICGFIQMQIGSSVSAH